MRCDRFREAISARIDGEDPGLPDGVLDDHLEACADCRDWQQRAHVATRHARLGGLFLVHDLTPQVLAAVPAAAAGRRLRLTQRAGLATVAALQVAITVPLLLLGHDHGAGSHAAHELGSFDLALAIAFAVGAVRPALAAGLAWPCAIAAAGLAGTALADMLGGQTPGADEAQHLVAVAGALLLIWQARTNGSRPAEGTTDASRTVLANTVLANTGPANTRPANRGPANTRPANTGTGTRPATTPTVLRPGHDAAAPADGSPGFPRRGGAAVVPVPAVAARAGDRAALPTDRKEGGRPAGEVGAEAVA